MGGAPPQVTLARLISWSEHPDPGVRYFSGTATYRKSLAVPARWFTSGRRIYLDLGRVEMTAQVKLNGHDLGILWKPPFRLDVTGALRAGPNALEVDVVNLWPNRIIGDEQLPADCKWLPAGYVHGWPLPNPAGNLAEWPAWLKAGRASPTGRHTFATWQLLTKDCPLLDSGLLGPVRLEAAERVPIPLPPPPIPAARSLPHSPPTRSLLRAAGNGANHCLVAAVRIISNRARYNSLSCKPTFLPALYCRSRSSLAGGGAEKWAVGRGSWAAGHGWSADCDGTPTAA